MVNKETKQNFQKYLKSGSLNRKNMEIEAFGEDRRIEQAVHFIIIQNKTVEDDYAAITVHILLHSNIMGISHFLEPQ
jgi:hypothetical protein